MFFPSLIKIFQVFTQTLLYITHLDAKPFRQHLRLVHPKKVATIKAKIENILRTGLIYPIRLIDWVSNIFTVMTKYGTIHVCVNYRDINRDRPSVVAATNTLQI